MKTSVTLPDESQGAGTLESAPASKTQEPIHVDFSKNEPSGSPFQKARSLDKRLKLFLWGDSGAGKTTLTRMLLEHKPLDLTLSISVTTRPRRSSEVDGIHYHFITSRYQDPADPLRLSRTFVDPLDHRLPAQVHQRLAWKASGAHSRRDDNSYFHT